MISAYNYNKYEARQIGYNLWIKFCKYSFI